MEIRNSDKITPDLIADYCYAHSSKAGVVLEQLKERTKAYGQINMLSGSLLGRVLSMYSKIIRPRVILEVGSFTCYGTICLSEGLDPDGKIITLEKNPELEGFASEELDRLGLTDRIDQRIGDASALIDKMEDVTIDLAFIDAAKRQYINYYELIMPRLRQGGVILADNTLWKGTVVDDRTDKLGEGLKAFNIHVCNDERVDNVLLPVDDGLHVIIKK